MPLSVPAIEVSGPKTWRARASWLDEQWPVPGVAAPEAGAGGVRRQSRSAAALAQRRRLAEALVAYARSLSAPSASLENAAALADAGTLALVTGQQVGVLLSPAYSLYKAVTAVLAAQRAQQFLGRRVVPVFWMATEDHDYAEVATVRYWDRDDRIATLSLPDRAQGPSVGALAVGESGCRLTDALLAGLPEGEARAAVSDWTRGTLGATATLGDWFGRQLLALLGDRGLVVLDPMQPALRELSSRIWSAAVARSDELRRAVERGAAEQSAAGLTPALEPVPGALHLFTYLGGNRVALFEREGTVRTRHGELGWSRAELLRRIASYPSEFSADVVLRPLTQDGILPTLAQVVGPGELAYLSQLTHVYEMFGTQPPPRHPRLGFTVVPPRLENRLGRLPEESAHRGDALRELLRQTMIAADGVDTRRVLNELRQHLFASYETIMPQLARIDPQLSEFALGNRDRLLRQTVHLERKAEQHQRRKHRDWIKEAERLAEVLLPHGDLQERWLSPYSFLGRWGSEWLDALFAVPDTQGHYVMHLVGPEGLPEQ